MNFILTNFLALGALFSGILTITAMNPVHNIIFVIITFVLAAGYLMMIGISFIGISYIIIYVGAIAVLFLFVIMMININIREIVDYGTQYTKNLPLALVIIFLYLIILFTIIPYNYNNVFALNILMDPFYLLNNLFTDSSQIIGHQLENLTILDSTIANPSVSDEEILSFNQIQTLGHGLYTFGSILLITLSLILLFAMMATIILTK